eukprot:11085269-Alexandrium_andersonii.AAC.1
MLPHRAAFRAPVSEPLTIMDRGATHGGVGVATVGALPTQTHGPGSRMGMQASETLRELRTLGQAARPRTRGRSSPMLGLAGTRPPPVGGTSPDRPGGAPQAPAAARSTWWTTGCGPT